MQKIKHIDQGEYLEEPYQPGKEVIGMAKPSKTILLADLEESLTGYGRIVEYRVYNSDFQPQNCKIERIKEGRFKKGKMEGYARKFTLTNNGTCFVGFYKEGKPDGKFSIFDKDGETTKQGVYQDSDCV